MIAWMIGFAFAPFSAVFYPVTILPAWAQTFAWCLPTTYIFEGMRLIINQGFFPYSYLVVSLVMSLFYLALSVTFFVWMFEKSRVKGLGRLE